MSVNLFIKIVANTTELLTGMNKANRAVRDFSKKTAKYMKYAAGAFATFTVGNQFTQQMEELAKLSQDINNSAKQMGASTEYYQKLSTVFQNLGADGHTAVDSLKTFNKILGDIRAGSGSEKGKILDSLGLDATELSLMRVEDRMSLVISKIEGIKNASDRARVTANLFEETGGRLFNALTSGAGDYANALKEASKYIIPDSQIQSMTKMANNMTLLGKAWEKFKMSMASSSIGAIWDLLISKQTQFILSISNSTSAVNEFVANLTGYFNVIYNLLKQSGAGWVELTAIISRFALQALIMAKKFVIGWKTALASVYKAIRGWSSQIYANLDGNELFQPLADSAQSLMIKFNTLYQGAQDGIKGTTEEISQLKDQVQEINDFILRVDKSWNVMKAWDEGYNGIKKLTEEFKGQSPVLDELLNKLKKMNDEIKKHGGKVKQQVQETTKDYQGMINVLDNSLSGFFDNLMDGSAKWGDFFKGILKQIASELIRIMFIQKVVSGVKSAFGGVSSTGITAYAKGGVVNTPTLFSNSGAPSLMGESGPEAILPLTRTSGGELGVKSQPSNVIVNNYSSNEVQVNQNGNDIEITIMKIADDIQRGGIIGNSIESRYGLQKR